MQGRQLVDGALASLMREHEMLSMLIDSLACYAKRLFESHEAGTQRSSSTQPGAQRSWSAEGERRDLAAFTAVLSGFADELHHEKEEEILQPILSRHGLCWQAGLLADVRMEHDRERYLIEVLQQAAECELAWTSEDRRSIAATALALATFQREHMEKENSELFPEVARRLSNSALEELRAALERFDRLPRHVAQGTELLAIADQLISRYPPAGRASAGATQSRDAALSAR